MKQEAIAMFVMDLSGYTVDMVIKGSVNIRISRAVNGLLCVICL
jgi:hypothetical protein